MTKYDRKRCWRYTKLGDWSGDYSPSQTTEHDTLPDHARGLVDHSPTMLGDSSTTRLRYARGLFRPLLDHSLRYVFLGYM
jgi:hypothetical protein